MAEQKDQKGTQKQPPTPAERGGEKSADQQGGKPGTGNRPGEGKGSEGTGSGAGGRGSNA